MLYRLLSHNRLDRMYVFARTIRLSRKKKKYARKRVKMIGGGYRGTNREYRETVCRYWKPYGIKPQKFWYDLYCSGQDAYDPRYIPDSVWYRKILPYFNNLLLRQAYVDKGMYNRLVTGVRKPETVVKRIGGYYYDGDGETAITRAEAEALCAKEEHLIFKPSTYTGGGAGLVFFDNEDHAQPVKDTFDGYISGFVAQRIVRQHPDLARINKGSLNTVRVVSFRFNEEVHILSTILRMGGVGARVDNISAGGISCQIKPDGWLVEKAVTRKSVWTDEHPSGLKFKDIKVPCFEKIIETVKRLHLTLPYFDLIGWDFAVNEDGEPVFIEFNVMPEQNQISCGPSFGELTDEVLAAVFGGKLPERF